MKRADRRRLREAAYRSEHLIRARAAHQHQAAPSVPLAPLPAESTRRGLVTRVKGFLVRRHLDTVLNSPALVPVVAVAVVAVFAAIAVGAVIGAALASSTRGGGDWS